MHSNSSRRRVGGPPGRLHILTVLRVLIALGLIGVLGLVGAPPAGAHAFLEELEPAPESVLDSPPAEVSLTFSESISVPEDALRVFDPSGRQIPGIAATADGDTLSAALPPLEVDGSYTVAWKVVSADGHPLSGAYLFHLRIATLTEPVDVGDTGVATWPAVVRAVGAVLALAALAYVLGSAAGRAARRESSDAGRDSTDVDGAPTRRESPPLSARRLRSAWAIVLLGTAVAFYGSIEAVGSSLSDGLSVSSGTATGRFSVVACLFALLGLLLELRGASRRVEGSIAVVTVVAIAVQGHAVAIDPILLSASFTTVHVLAAVAWGAGLFWLEGRTRRSDPAQLRQEVERRSPLAMGAVAVLAVSGVLLVLDRVSPDLLVSSWYGRLAILKSALLAAAIVLALRNRVVLAPALATAPAPATEPQAAAGQDPDPAVELAVGRLRRSVRLEMLVLAAALVAGAALSQISPPVGDGASTGGPFAERLAFGDGTVDLTVDPGARGTNEVHVTAIGADGRLMNDLEDLKIELSLASQNIGPLAPEMQPVVVGHSLSYARFPFGGEWTVLVTATVGRFEALSATFTVSISP